MVNVSGRPHILLADQGTLLQGVLAPFLETSGWECRCVGDEDSALQAVVQGNYDLILLDAQISNGSCLGLLKLLRDRKPEQAIVLVMRQGDPVCVDELRQAGALDCIEFPVDCAVLQDLMQRVLTCLNPLEKAAQLCQSVSAESCKWEFESQELGEFIPTLPIVDKLYSSGRIDHSTRLKLLLAFQEAFANALEHGNLELSSSLKDEINAAGVDKYSIERRERLKDPHYAKRKVYISTDYDGSALIVKIRDEGKGFLHQQADIFDLKKNNLSCHGRGLAMINSSVDEAYYQEGGRQLVMVKNINRI